MLLSTTEHRVKEKGTIEHRGLSHDRYYDAEPRPGARAQCRHVTEISCINGALLGSFGSSLDSAAHLANFFMSISPDVPIAEMASALFKALKRKGSLHETGFFFFYHGAAWVRTTQPRGALFRGAVTFPERKSDD